MKRIRRFAGIFLLAAVTAGARAQSTPVTVSTSPPVVAPVIRASRPAGVTTLVMGFDVANGIVAAAPGSRVRVPPFEQVNLQLPEGWTLPIQWTKDNKPIVGATGRTYVIPFATTSDSGVYHVTGATFPSFSTGIMLDVVSPGNVGNFSTRAELAAGATQTVGFVVSGATTKNLLVRAVGPSLRAFGVAKPVAQPRFRIFDSTGKEVGFTHVAVVVDLAAFYASVGAFPLTDGATDAVDYGDFKPGAYTLQVTDQAGVGGTVLIETYEYSTGPAPFISAPVTPGG